MDKQAKADILGCRVNFFSAEEVITRIKELINNGEPAQIITLNAEIVCQAQESPELREIINGAEIVTPDGIGVVWGARKLGYEISERITGIDLVYRICEEAPQEGWKIYLFGSAPGVADEAARRLCATYPGLQICGTRHGYFDDKEMSAIIQEIKEQAPQILFVALGAPKQEHIINKYKEQLGVPACIGVGGSFDVIAGQKKRAPNWMIKLNLEWLYRLLAEPRRLRRQMVLPKFVVLILKNRYRGGI